MKMESGPSSLMLQVPYKSQKLQNAATIVHTAKTIVKTLRRTERKIEDVPGEDQFEFRRRKGTGEATQN